MGVLLTAAWHYESAVNICSNVYLLINDMVNVVLRILRVDIYMMEYIVDDFCVFRSKRRAMNKLVVPDIVENWTT